ncbi:4-hydroxy-tetrahydrodipicolinate synthase [Geomicrobium sp. JCM 19038]|uniref:4-hydroxy-tetrahydrodipicolinate synthase n=1 Tax=Geomicrobium sp. JCM 19038 TaxID=1460635 RepID=UPI00045F1E40|nr:4-hydroxy-tetrahydrodipicolinate synthase [Geomicrobium sp. JCM 19038]GAK09846.1 dihydrodipicolinate synthase [Geomicrobium sp. JCM 19038]
MIHGILTALMTPMNHNQTIDHDQTRSLVRHLVNSGVHGLFALGTNGEFHTLSSSEKIAFTKTVVHEVNGQIPVIVGTGGISTEATIAFSKQLEEVFIDAFSVITPYFVKLSQDELQEHFERIADAVDVPIMLYNIPGLTGNHLEPVTVQALSKHPNIIGIKDSSGDLETIKQYKARCDETFLLLSGNDSLILDTLSIGGHGGIAATSNLFPELVVSIYQHYQNGNIEGANKAQEQLGPIRHMMQKASIPSVNKKAMELLGLPIGPPRLPTKEISPALVTELQDMLKQHYNY